MALSLTHSSRPPLSKFMVLGITGVVFLVNGLILAYAVHVALPGDHAPVASPATLTNVVGAAPTAAPNGEMTIPRVVADIALPGQTEVQSLFVQHCAACHGLDGRGRGPAAEQLFPKPRDFVESPFRFASSTGDRDEVIAALERTITQGVPRSAMPGFGGVLSESQIAGLARHVLDLRGDKAALVGGALHVYIGRHPPMTTALIERGRELYTALGCVTCHGESGHGDGPGSKGLFDSTNRPVKPGDLASGLFKSGQTSESIARTILAGVPGTPMTPYEAMVIKTSDGGSKDSTELWALVAFIQSMSPRSAPPGIPSGANLHVISAPDAAMLNDPSHIGWLGVPETTIGLRPLWQREEQTTAVNVRAVEADGRIAICLDWKDSTLNIARDIDVYPDGAAVMFALGDEVPALPMGVQIEGHEPREPVNIWQWRADRQYDAVKTQRFAATHMEEGAASRWYMFSKDRDSKVPDMLGNDLGMVYPAPADDAEYYTAGAVGNVLSEPALVQHAALEANALGFGTLTLQPDSGQATTATAAWSDGVWRVILTRSVDTDETNDIQFKEARRIPLAFAIWDGAKDDHAGVKLVSGWHWLSIDAPVATTPQ